MKKSNVIIMENIVSKAMCNKDRGESLRNISRVLLSEYSQDDYVKGMTNKLLEIANHLDDTFDYTYNGVNHIVKDEGIEDK